MAYTRKIRVEYFKVVTAKKDGQGKDKDYDLEQLIKTADNMSIENRIFNYYQEEARLDKMYFEKSTEYWYLNFMRMRQTKLPQLVKRGSQGESFILDEDEYIGEDVTALYDHKNNILALQRNRDSLSATGIEFYLTKLYNNEGYGIYLRPIINAHIQEKIAKAKSYRKIALKFDTNINKEKRILPNTSLSRFFNIFKDYDANTVTLTMSLGKGNIKGSLDIDTIGDTIREISESENFVIGAELNVKYNEIDPVDTIDLFTMKYFDILKINVEKLEAIPFIKIGEKICITYNNRKKELLAE